MKEEFIENQLFELKNLQDSEGYAIFISDMMRMRDNDLLGMLSTNDEDISSMLRYKHRINLLNEIIGWLPDFKNELKKLNKGD